MGNPTTRQKSSANTMNGNSTGELGQDPVSGGESVPHCGIIMPISTIDGCEPAHWKRVGRILDEAISGAGYKPRIVSDSDAVAIIQKTIVQNIYNDEIIVCDISCRNANVMFELGLRLAFDKPVVIVKDEMTPYPFDTGSIEHLTYPRSLSYWEILDFQALLTSKLKSTAAAARNAGYSPFLKHYGDIKATSLPTTEVSTIEYFEKRFDELSARIESSSSQRAIESLKLQTPSGHSFRNFELSVRFNPGSPVASTVEKYLLGTPGIKIDKLEFGAAKLVAKGSGAPSSIKRLTAIFEDLDVEATFAFGQMDGVSVSLS